MLVVRLEVWPGGRERDRREVGRVTIANESGLASISDYSVRIDGQEMPGVRGHERAKGAWDLVWRALSGALANGTET